MGRERGRRGLVKLKIEVLGGGKGKEQVLEFKEVGK